VRSECYKFTKLGNKPNVLGHVDDMQGLYRGRLTAWQARPDQFNDHVCTDDYAPSCDGLTTELHALIRRMSIERKPLWERRVFTVSYSSSGLRSRSRVSPNTW